MTVVNVVREYLINDPEEDMRPDGSRIQLRLFEIHVEGQVVYVSAEQKPYADLTYKYCQLFNVDGTPGPYMPASGYHKLLAARDEFRAAQRVLESARKVSEQQAIQARKAAREAWHQSVAERNAAIEASREQRRRTQLEAKVLRLKGELAAAELEMMGL